MDSNTLFNEFQADLADGNEWANMGQMAKYIGGNQKSFVANASGPEAGGGVETFLNKYNANDAFYSVTVTNTTSTAASVSLFDALNNAFGSTPGIPAAVSVSGNPTPYAAYLKRVLNSPRLVKSVKLQVSAFGGASITPSDQFANAWSLVTSSGEGNFSSQTFMPTRFYKETAFNANILTIESFILPLTSDTAIQFTLNANTALTLTFGIASKIEQENLLKGEAALTVPYDMTGA